MSVAKLLLVISCRRVPIPLVRESITATASCVYCSYVQGGLRNQTEPAKPKRIEAFDSGTGRNRTRKRTEPNRTKPRRVRKTAGRTASNREQSFSESNRTEPIIFRIVRNRTESNRTGSFLTWTVAVVVYVSCVVRSL